ncbi:GNAT family N-acetyltransferase [Stenotrophomonas rhizophila]
MDDSPLHADGLLLRPFEDADAASFAAAVRESAEGMRRWMPWSSVDYRVEQALQWFQACRDGWAAGTACEYGIFDQDTAAFVGGAGLNKIQHHPRFCNLGYWVRQSCRGQGVAPASSGRWLPRRSGRWACIGWRSSWPWAMRPANGWR